MDALQIFARSSSLSSGSRHFHALSTVTKQNDLSTQFKARVASARQPYQRRVFHQQKIVSIGFGSPRPFFELIHRLFYPLTRRYEKVVVPPKHEAIVFYDRLPCFHVTSPSVYSFNPIGRTVKLIPTNLQFSQLGDVKVRIFKEGLRSTAHLQAKVSWQITRAQDVVWLNDIPTNIERSLSFVLENLFLEEPELLLKLPSLILDATVKSKLSHDLEWCSIKIHDVSIIH